MDRNEAPHQLHHLEVQSALSKTIFQAYGTFWHKPCTYLALTQTPTLSRPKWDLTWPTSPRSSIGCVQNDFRAYGTFGVNNAPILRQDVHHLHMDLNELPLEPCHLGVSLGASKMILSLWYVWHKSCTYLALTLTPSLNGSKQHSTWAMSPRSCISCVQNDFQANGTFGANHTPILCQD
jgi:hypothetical protein